MGENIFKGGRGRSKENQINDIGKVKIQANLLYLLQTLIHLK